MEDTSAPNVSKWMRRFKWANHPVSTVTFFLTSVILGIWLFSAGISRRNLIYSVNSARTLVVGSDKNSRLRVTYNDAPVTPPVTAVQLAFWNAGKEPIWERDVLERVTLNSEPKVRILEAKILHEARSISALKINDSRKLDGELGFDWKILEQNDGALIQIIFEGSPAANFRLDGTIVGQSEIRDLSPQSKQFSVQEAVVILSGFLLAMAITTWIGVRLENFFDTTVQRSLLRWLAISTIFLTLLAVCVGLTAVVYLPFYPWPPNWAL